MTFTAGQDSQELAGEAASVDHIGAEQDPVLDYATQVLNGSIIAGPHVRAACARHLRDLEHARARGWVWNLDKALYRIAFYETFLRLNGGAFEGLPFILTPWQKFIVGSLHGWVDASTGLRRFRTAYIEIGKGNGKSPLAAAEGIGALMIDGEERAEVYAAATKKDQAMILFRDAVAMVDQSALIASKIVKSGRGQSTWNLAYPATNSFFRPISSDDGQSGPRPHVALVDEVHEHKDGTVLDMLRRGFKGRTQPLIIEITNSGSSRQSLCWEHHEASIAAVNAEPDQPGFDDTWFSFVCGLDVGDDWMRDETCWAKANPNLGVSMPVQVLRDAVREARNLPSKRNLIARLHFCEWTDATEAWIGAEVWLKAEVHPGPVYKLVSREAFRNRRVYAGIDLSKRQDLTAFAVFLPDEHGGGDAFVEFWTPEATLRERAEQDKVPYDLWVRDGYLNAVPGSSLDYLPIARQIKQLIETLDLDVAEAAFDRWRIDEFRKDMDKADLQLKITEFGQGFKSMTPAVECIENLILNGKLRVHYNPVLRWNAASAVTVEDDAGGRKFSKRKATGRIDGIVALTMAIGACNASNGFSVIGSDYEFMSV